MSKVDVVADGCWNWKAWTGSSGYGTFHIVKGKPRSAHRVSYQFFVGTIPDGMMVLHRCDNKLCVRPSHLWIGNQFDNMQDAKKKGRLADTIKYTRGSRGNKKLTEKQVRDIRNKYIPRQYTMKMLSMEYKTDLVNIWNIIHRKTWVHV